MVRPPSRFRRPAAAAGAVVLVTAGLSQFQLAEAADPGAGTVKPTSPTATWQGERFATAATVDPTACPSKSEDPANALCDHYTLKVPVDPSYWSGKDGGAEVTVSWPDSGDDFDLFVYKGGDMVASSAQGGTSKETVLISEASGTYEVRVVPFLVTDSAYNGTATFKAAAAGGAGGEPPLGGPAEYHGTVFKDFNCPQLELPCLPDQEPRNRRIDSPFPSLVLKSGPVGRDAAEPTLSVDAKGRAFYAAATFDGPGGLANTQILRSTNDGNTWEDTNAPTNLPITLDPYVYVEENSGRLFDLDLYVADAFLNFSDDGGKTYMANPIAGGGLDNVVQDHQTLFAGPVPAGSPLVTIDPKFNEILYYCYNKVADVQCTRSIDGGVSFSGLGLTPPYPGVEPKEGGAFCGGLHGHLATDRAGRVFLPKGHCERPYLARSNDAGMTWQRDPVSDRIDMPDDHSAVSTDAANNIYYVWYDSQYRLPWLAISRDHGKTFGDPIMIAPPGVKEIQFPTVAAGADGRVAITFVGTTEKDQTDLSRPWNHYVTTSLNATGPNPTFVSNISNPPTDPVHRGDCPGRCGNMLDFLDVIVSPAPGKPATATRPREQGHSIWATVVDTCTTKLQCNSSPNANGFSDDDGDGVAADSKGIYIKQISGPNVGW